MEKLKPVLRVLLALVVAEICLVLIITFFQNVLFDGVTWTYSPWSHLLIGGMGTVFAAVVAGYIGVYIVRFRNYFPAIIMTVLFALETSWIIRTNQTPDPAWFDISAAVGLVVGLWFGAMLPKFWPRLAKRDWQNAV